MSRRYDVAIVGYGPVGAILANILGKAGCSVLCVDRAADIYDKPRAINIDHEVMRVLQSVGLADELLSGMLQHPGTDFLGIDGALIKTFEPLRPPYPLHWPPNLVFVQPEFEPVVRARAGSYPTVDVRLSTECVALEDNGDEVRLTLNGGGKSEEASARYVVGCDGAASSVRKWLGIGHESLEFDEYWTVVDAWLLEDTPLPRRTTHFCWPNGPATYVVGPRNLRRWEVKLLPGESVQDFEDVDYLKRRLSSYVDPGALDLWRVATYRFHALVAEEWQRGRVFLAGDAAHQMPPFIAQGLCSGVRDVVNLGWKLCGVLNGTYDERLLHTYEAERKPHIRRLTETAKGIGQIIGELDRGAAVQRDATMVAARARGEVVNVRQALIPRLAGGVLGQTDVGLPALAAGELFPQPRVQSPDATVALLDDLIGDRFLVLTRAGEAMPDGVADLPVSIVHLEIAPRGEVVGGGIVVSDLDGTLLDWMDRERMVAVLVRPDRYVFGAARSVEECDVLIDQLLAVVPFVTKRAA